MLFRSNSSMLSPMTPEGGLASSDIAPITPSTTSKCIISSPWQISVRCVAKSLCLAVTARKHQMNSPDVY